MSEKAPWWPPPDGTVDYDRRGRRKGEYQGGKLVRDRPGVSTRAIALAVRVCVWIVGDLRAGFVTGPVVAVLTLAGFFFLQWAGDPGWVVLGALQAGLAWRAFWAGLWDRAWAAALVITCLAVAIHFMG